jgi:hypothetical protein
MEALRYYIANNSGLSVMRGNGGALRSVGTFFDGRTVDHVIGGRKKPEIVFAAVVDDGGYRSRDAGATWEKVMDGDVRHFAIDPHDERIVYVVIGPVRLLRSEDGGTTWEPLDGLLAVGDDVKAKWDVPGSYRGIAVPHVRYLFIHPDDSNLLFVLLEHGGVLASEDGGATWDDRSDGIDYVDMHMLGNVPGSTDRYFVSSAQGFYRTDDRGKHWVRSERGMPWTGKPRYCYSHEWRFVPGFDRMVVCGGRGSPGVWNAEAVDPKGHLLLSDDGGENWRIATNGLSAELPMMPWVLLPHPTESQRLFCAMGDGGRGFRYDAHPGRGALYTSPDAGESWEPLLLELPSVLTGWVAED